MQLLPKEKDCCSCQEKGKFGDLYLNGSDEAVRLIGILLRTLQVLKAASFQADFVVYCAK